MHDQFVPPKESRVPYSFMIFMFNIGSIALSILYSIVAAALSWDMKHTPLSNLPSIAGILLLSSGIYAGTTYRSTEQRKVRLNKIGLWGNGVLMAFVAIGLFGVIVLRSYYK